MSIVNTPPPTHVAFETTPYQANGRGFLNCTLTPFFHLSQQIYPKLIWMAPSDPRRPDKVYRYPKNAQAVGGSAEYFNAIGMVCSLVGLLMKV